MNATTPVPAVDDRIATFAAAVRAQLADLPTDDVDDLVDGLDADLAEQAAESDAFELPDPVAYAAELRSAAGLPEPSKTFVSPRLPLSTRVSDSFVELFRGIHSSGTRLVDGLRSSRTGAWTLDLLISLRAVWWIARGWAAYAILAPLIGASSDVIGFPWTNTGGWLLLGALVLLSIEWGRGRWASVAWLRMMRAAVSVITAIALPFLVTAAIGSVQTLINNARFVETALDSQPGLVVDGTRVRNIFAYDADGNPITAVQLFDESGRPLTTVGTQGDASSAPIDYYFWGGGGPVPVPIDEPGRQPVWNVFPLQELPAGTGFDGAEPDLDEAEAPIFPFVQVPAVEVEVETGTPTPTPTPTPSDAVEPSGERDATVGASSTGANG